VLLAESLIPVASAAGGQSEPGFNQSIDNAVALYKTTPQGDLKIHPLLPAGIARRTGSAGDCPLAVVFFFGGSGATGSPAQSAASSPT